MQFAGLVTKNRDLANPLTDDGAGVWCDFVHGRDLAGCQVGRELCGDVEVFLDEVSGRPHADA